VYILRNCGEHQAIFTFTTKLTNLSMAVLCVITAGSYDADDVIYFTLLKKHH